MDMIARQQQMATNKAKERKAISKMEVMERAPLSISDTLMNRNTIAAQSAYDSDNKVMPPTLGNDYYRGSYTPPNAPYGPHYNAQEAVITNSAASSVNNRRGDMVHGPLSTTAEAEGQITDYDLQLARFKSANPHLTEKQAKEMDPDPLGLRGIIPGNFDLASLMSPIAKWWENR